MKEAFNYLSKLTEIERKNSPEFFLRRKLFFIRKWKTSKLFEKLRKGDTVVVWKLDRLGRSLIDLIDLITKMQQLDVSFLSIQDGFNTNTATGRFTFNIFASLAEFEREIISERTKAGLTSARARGRKGGKTSRL